MSPVRLNIKPRNFKEETYRTKDKVAENFQLIYRAPMESYFSFTKHFTTFSLGCISTLMLYRYLAGLHLIDVPADFTGFGGLEATESEMWFFLAGFTVVTVFIRGFVNRFPLRIYKSGTKYTSVFEGNTPLTKRQSHFERGDVKEAITKRFLPWSDLTYTVKNQKVILLVNHFKTPSELNTMLSVKDNLN